MYGYVCARLTGIIVQNSRKNKVKSVSLVTLSYTILVGKAMRKLVEFIQRLS